ncbi:MAG: integrase core domain-containing protein [Alphaproteobacteria bacterium]|nr:integrase core domain-containing protein [Alphaproteobacteria bacterium]
MWTTFARPSASKINMRAKGLALVVDTLLPGLCVVRELERLRLMRGTPKCIKSDNGTEMTCRAVLLWAAEHHIEWNSITPGRPMKNGFTESFNGRMRDEFLNQNISRPWPKRSIWPRHGLRITTTSAHTVA